MSLARRTALRVYHALGARRLAPPDVTDNLCSAWGIGFTRPRVQQYRVPTFVAPATNGFRFAHRLPAVASLRLIAAPYSMGLALLDCRPDIASLPVQPLTWTPAVTGKYFTPHIHRTRTPIQIRDISKLRLIKRAAARQVGEEHLWETIYLLLQPPLDLRLPKYIDLPHKLLPHQPAGIEFLAKTRPGALLGDDMGLGKTVQAIVALRLLMQQGVVRRALVVCPTSVLRQWVGEFEQWAPLLRCLVAYGERDTRRRSWGLDTHVVLTTYATLREDIDVIVDRTKREPGFRFDVVILDEITNVKNPGSQQSQAARKLPRERAWGLSGTPLENREDDIIAEFDFLHPQLFKGRAHMTTDEVRDAIKPYFLRRRKQDVLEELPDLIHSDTWVELTPQQETTYRRALEEGVVELRKKGESVTVQHVFALLGKLREISNIDPATGASAKIEWLLDRLDGLGPASDKVLVFSNYIESGVDAIAGRLPTEMVLSYTGRTTPAQREKVLQQFRTDPTKQVLLLTYGAGGLGLNLQCANYVVLFDHWWNPARNKQAIDRAHRLGQEHDVVIAYSLWAQTEVEERIFEILERKRRLFEFVIDSQAVAGIEGTGLTEEELFGVFDLVPAPRRRSQDGRQRPVSPETLLGLEPVAFERLVGDVWRAMGYEVVVTQPSADSGIDVIASKGHGPNAEHIAIQCKNHRYPVGRPDAQKFIGATHASHYSKVILVATSGFTAECIRYAEENGILNLIDGKELCEWMHQFSVEMPR